MLYGVYLHFGQGIVVEFSERDADLRPHVKTESTVQLRGCFNYYSSSAVVALGPGGQPSIEASVCMILRDEEQDVDGPTTSNSRHGSSWRAVSVI